MANIFFPKVISDRVYGFPKSEPSKLTIITRRKLLIRVHTLFMLQSILDNPEFNIGSMRILENPRSGVWIGT